ncbi:hypothetical protein Bcop_1720 [Bacteroides coprosuis DSM 18011]|uniref:Uncharacterized protein n=1 Tax=Bacteroides coprosuis DSM 18011 TaxID=679937 RepID=F3ZRA4_9BACE|nr:MULTISPECIES: hypothetical protein [Bacteroides]EGJ71912.1 hypothetical protein Bcop_1720 [Bacteroides coprosuis DSM 18011]HJD91136.1 hypothetical protein [Bacteroides coprosuis]
MKVKVVSTPFPELLMRWKKAKGEVADKAISCDQAKCKVEDIMGCLVEKVDCNKGQYYIVPICKDCATPVSRYEVDENLLVHFDKNKA